jgi:hypothetical protein
MFPAIFSLLHTTPVESLWDNIGLNRAVFIIYYYPFLWQKKGWPATIHTLFSAKKTTLSLNTFRD